MLVFSQFLTIISDRTLTAFQLSLKSNDLLLQNENPVLLLLSADLPLILSFLLVFDEQMRLGTVAVHFGIGLIAMSVQLDGSMNGLRYIFEGESRVCSLHRLTLNNDLVLLNLTHYEPTIHSNYSSTKQE